MSDQQLFGKYRLVRRLAFGGMAEIFLARLIGDQGFEKTLVLKRILPQFSSDADFTRMFVDEAVLAARLTHPNVAQIYDFGEVDGTYFITMELVDGADLRAIIRGGNERGRGLTPIEVAAVGEGMARGLAYVHALEGDDGKPLQIIHRDISPHNVMLTRGGDVKIMDFGIAKAAARATHTATGTIKGKLAYMAPEQALAEDIDKRADQYAVGLTLWECLTGKRVFEGDSEPELMSKVAAGRVRDLRSEKADVPDVLAAIVMRMLKPKREDRYADLRDVEQDLATFRYSLGATGAVRLSGLVDELVPREAAKPLPAKQGTAVLPGVDASATPAPSRQSVPAVELAMESGWSAMEGTEATRALEAEPRPLPAAPTVIKEPPRAKGKVIGAVLATVVVAAGVALLLGHVAREETATLTLGSVPPGAEVLLATREGEELLPTGLVTPAPISGKRGETVRYRLRLAGYEVSEGTTALREGSQQIALKAEKSLADKPMADKPTADGPIADRPMTDKPIADKPMTEKPPTAKPKSAKADGPSGFLSLRTRGSWAEVRLNGKVLGTTPLKHREVPAGLLVLQLRSPAGVTESLTIDVPKGEHVQKTIEIR